MKFRAFAFGPAVLAAWLFALPISAQAREALRIAVASNFAPTLETLIQSYQSEFPDAPEITLSTGSTGAHYALISRGAPFDLFFAADNSRPEKLVENATAIAQRAYAIGIPVLVLPQGEQGEATSAQSIGALMKGKRIAIADPALAPYGIAAMQVIQWAGLDPQSDLELIYGANAGLAASLFALKTSDGAIIAKSQLSQIKAHRDFRAIALPQASHTPVWQNVALISDRPEARAFYEWSTTSDAARAIIGQEGYLLAMISGETDARASYSQDGAIQNATPKIAAQTSIQPQTKSAATQ
ncbi:MAG: molybdate ABC transporter substrate-binding protein [Paracoccaceae bacterium]